MQITASRVLNPFVVAPATISELASITDCKVINSDTGATVTNSYDLANWQGVNPAFTKIFTDRFDINAGTTMNLALTCDISSAAPATLAGVSLTGQINARVLGDIRNLDSNLQVKLAGYCSVLGLDRQPAVHPRLRAYGRCFFLAGFGHGDQGLDG